MADEEVVTPPEGQISETQPQTPAQEELPLAATPPETDQEVQPPETPPEPDKPVEEAKPPAWQEKELKSKHRQLQDAKRREAELQAELETKNALLAKFNQVPQPTEVPPGYVPQTEVQRLAAEERARDKFNEECIKTQTSGEKNYGDGWKGAVENLEILGGFDPATMNGVLATDDPAKVIYELGKNPDRYHTIMQMPLERRIIEMGKLAMAPAAKPISQAPAPINPVGGRAAPASETLRDDMDDDTWNKIRMAQKRKKWEANNAPRR